MSHKRPNPARVYAPPGANTTIPENLPPPGVINPGLVKNLRNCSVCTGRCVDPCEVGVLMTHKHYLLSMNIFYFHAA